MSSDPLGLQSFADVWRIALGFGGTYATIMSAVFTVPVPALVQFYWSGSVVDHSPAPHLSAFLSSMLWILYGLPFVQPNGILVITANGACCLIAMLYLIVFAIFSKSWKDKRKQICTVMLLDVVIVGVIAATALTVAHETKLRYHIIGVVAMICQIGSYVAPLSTLNLAVKTNNMELIDLRVAAYNGTNYVVWCLYAAVPFDVYLLVPNVIGMVLAFTQVTLFHRYAATMMNVHGIDVLPTAICECIL